MKGKKKKRGEEEKEEDISLSSFLYSSI